MKKFISILVIVFACVFTASAQTTTTGSVTRNGKTFSFAGSGRRSTVRDTLVTEYKWSDASGKEYPIIINKSTGRCYIYKVSKKTGKLYKYYMKEEVSRQICSELHVTFVEKD